MYTLQELKDQLAKITGDAIKNLGYLNTEEFHDSARYRDGVGYPATEWRSHHKDGVEFINIYWKNKHITLRFKFGCPREQISKETLIGWNGRIEETVKACVMMYDHVLEEVFKDQPK